MGFSLPNPLDGAKKLIRAATDVLPKLVDRGVDAVEDAAGSVVDTVDHYIDNVKDFYNHPNLSKGQLNDLFRLADARPDLAWKGDKSIGAARNAHFTNTPEEMARALRGNYDWLEGDVRLEGGLRSLPAIGDRKAIMAHAPQDIHGMTLDEWVQVCMRSGRGMKIDLKQATAVDEMLEVLARHHVPDERLILNVGIGWGPGGLGGVPNELFNSALDPWVSENDLKKIRAAHPNVVINLSSLTRPQPPGTTYSEHQIKKMIHLAQVTGQPVMFPLRAEFVTPEVVAQLKPYGKIAIWNDPSSYKPQDVEADIRRFRAMGVDGVIDLMTEH